MLFEPGLGTVPDQQELLKFSNVHDLKRSDFHLMDLQIFPLTVVYWTRGDERGEHRAAAPAGTPEYQRERAASLNRDKGAGREKSAVSVGVSGDVEPAAP